MHTFGCYSMSTLSADSHWLRSAHSVPCPVRSPACSAALDLLRRAPRAATSPIQRPVPLPAPATASAPGSNPRHRTSAAPSSCPTLIPATEWVRPPDLLCDNLDCLAG